MYYCVFLHAGESCRCLQKESTLQFILAKNRPLMAGSHCQNKQHHVKCALKLAIGCRVEWWESQLSCSYCPIDSNWSNKPNNLWHLMCLGQTGKDKMLWVVLGIDTDFPVELDYDLYIYIYTFLIHYKNTNLIHNIKTRY